MDVDKMTTVQRKQPSGNPQALLGYSMREGVKKLHQWWNSIGRVSPGSLDRMRVYFISLTGASLTFSDVVTSDERERQS